MSLICKGCPNQPLISKRVPLHINVCCHKSLLPIPASLFNDAIIENLKAQCKAHVQKLWSEKK